MLKSKTYWRGCVSLGAILVLSGCASLYKPQAPEVVNAEAAVPAAEEFAAYAPASLPRTDWVESFNDPRLEALVAQAVEQNTTIRAALFAVDASLAGVDTAESFQLPSLSGSGGVSRQQRFENGTFFVNGVPVSSGQPLGQTNFSLGLSSNWEPDFWNRISDRVSAAELEVAGSEADLAAARLSIVGQVVLAYFDLIEAQQLVALSERDVETQQRSQLLTERRFESGLAGSADVRLARSAVASSEALKATREQQRGNTARRLEVLLRNYPADALEARESLPDLPALSGAGDPAGVLERRPDLIAQEARLHAQGIQVDLARKALLPSINLTGRFDDNVTNFTDLLSPESLVANLGASLSLPIFQNGRLRADVDRQEAILARSLENYAGAALTAFNEIEDALAAERQLAERETALETSLIESQRAEERLELRYTEGLATILQLLDAQSRRLNAEGQLITARAERLANRVRLHVALGGGDGNTPSVASGSALASNQTSLLQTSGAISP